MGSGRCRPDATDSQGGRAPQDPASQDPASARAIGARTRVLVLSLLGALLLAGLLAQPALAVRRVSIIFTCTSTKFVYSGFPEVPKNQVTEKMHADGVKMFNEKFEFDGSSGESSIETPLSTGMHKVVGEAHWNTNGVIGESGKHKEHLKCGAEPKPSFSIVKLQQIAGSSSGFTAEEITGKIGQTVDYQMTVSNTGNVPFTLSSFFDEKCDPGTLAGGPEGATVAPAGKVVFTCTHMLTTGGSYTNVASATATFQEGGTQVHESRPVTVKVLLEARLSLSKAQEIKGSGAGFTAATLTGAVGQTVLYQITAKNTGNATLVISEFTDIYCDLGTISGGPGPGGTLAPGASTVYSCSHKLTETDLNDETSSYSNIASVRGTPAGGAGIVVASNMVIVAVTATPVPGKTGTPGSPNTPGGGGGTGTGTTTTPGSGVGTVGTTHPASKGALGTKSSKKKHRRKVTVAHKTPRFTG